jgi:hypothetical protein
MFKKEQVAVIMERNCVMLGSQDPRSSLWRVDLKKPKSKLQPACNHAHETSNQKELINYLHTACFSPVNSTCIAAIKNGKFTSWPGITERAVERHLSKSTETFKGHLNQQRMNTRSTKIKEEEICDNTDTDLDNGIKTNCIYAATIDAGQLYTDQTE